MGYNGLTHGMEAGNISWERKGDPQDTKYPYIVHAELNAILNAKGRDLSGCIIYTTMYPCQECSKSIIQVGLKGVIYLDPYPESVWWTDVSSHLLAIGGVSLIQHRWGPRGKKLYEALACDTI
jgi:dCMP deaminase